MELFELKPIHEITWEDIPFIEALAFAFSHTFSALNYPNGIWMRVINIREFINAEFGGAYNPIQQYSYGEDKVRWLLETGRYFCVSRTGKPFLSAFKWKEDSNHPLKGEWIDPRREFYMNTSILPRFARLGQQWHRARTQAYMDELMESPYAIARAIEEEVLAAPRAIRAAVEKPIPVVAAPVIDAIAEPAKTITVDTQTEQPEPTYKVLKGKYGTLHDYGDYIVHWDIDNVVGRTDITSKPAYKVRHCYALGEGYGLPITDNIAPGKPLLDFGSEIPHGTIFATFVPDGNGNLVYPNSRNGIKKSPHLFVYDANSGGLREVGGEKSVSVIEQWAGLERVSMQNIKNNNSDGYRLYKHLEDYYAVTIK
jgi:hypothetical protein